MLSPSRGSDACFLSCLVYVLYGVQLLASGEILQDSGRSTVEEVTRVAISSSRFSAVRVKRLGGSRERETGRQDGI